MRARFVLAAVALLACERRAKPQEPATLPPPAPPPPVLECRYDPVSRPGNAPSDGLDVCYLPDEALVWREPPPAADAGADAGDAAADAGPTQPCPDDMLLVDGQYCPKVVHTCDKGVEAAGVLKGQRCAEYGEPKCDSDREHRRFCIDRDEYAPEEEALPLVHHSWTMARDTCQSLGKRMCFGSEWEFACEGEEMRPYPYGYVRDASLCNHDRKNLSLRGKLRDLRVESDERPNCLSPFGVRNLVGNVDEWTIRDGFIKPYRSALRGGWWLAGRNNCRAATTAHDEFYFGPQTGFRCCKDAAY